MADQKLHDSAERLRLAVPLMTRYGIPATPENYAVWFHYVSGDRPALKSHLDQLLEQQVKFDDTLNERLYNEFAAECNIGELEQIRQLVRTTLDDTSEALNSTGSEAERFGNVLERFDSGCLKAESIDDVYSLLTEVLEETRQMKSSMQSIKSDFDAKSAEMEQLRRELEEVRQQASSDPLTGLSNRATFFDLLKACHEADADGIHTHCVVMLDIDHFKRVNDTFGHLVGDKVIRFVAEVLQNLVKGQDTAARYGGEEFALLLPDTALDGALALCNNIRRRIEETNLVRSGTRESLGTITISGGVAQFRAGEEHRELLQRADRALYRSKANGRNQVTADRG